jgi:23S rRNA (guanosine2251-2'-O)-methyltransferase
VTFKRDHRRRDNREGGAAPERWRQERQARKDEREGPQWIYGHHAVTAALENPRRKWQRLVATRNAARGLEARQPEILEPRAIDKLLPPDAVHQGLAMLAEPLEQPPLPALLEARVPLVFLDHVTDPHNVGAILRSCAAFGFGAVVTTVRHAPPVTGVLAKSASGALEHVPYVQIANLAEALVLAGEASYVRLGLDERGEPIEPALAATKEFAMALVLGAEGEGLRERTKTTCDRLVRLPTTGPIGALNVSNATAVALYAVTRFRS